MLDVALRTLDTALRMFTDFAYVGYSFCACRADFAYVVYGFCACCAAFSYVYGFGIDVFGIDRSILSRWSNITVHYAALVAI